MQKNKKALIGFALLLLVFFTSCLTIFAQDTGKTTPATVQQIPYISGTASISAGYSETLKAVGISGNVTWKNSNPGILKLSVSKNSVRVLGLKAGKSTVSFKYKNKVYKKSITVTQKISQNLLS